MARCCDRCDRIRSVSYELSGDGDGIEFLVETARLVDGGRATSTVVFAAPGLRESA